MTIYRRLAGEHSTSGSVALPAEEKSVRPSIAIVSRNKFKSSETFIHNHVRHLPAEIHYLTGDWLPTVYCRGLSGDDRPFLEGVSAKAGEPGWEEQKSNRTLAISRYLREHKIEAVLAEYGLTGVEVMSICRETAVPLVVYFHGFDAFRNDILQGYGLRYPELFETAAALAGASRQICDHLQRLGADEHKVHFLPCGYDAQLFRPKGGGRPPIFLAVGRFTDKKAPYLTLLAFERARRECPDARLWMIGDGDLRPMCETLARALGIGSAVEFLGELDHEQVAARMGMARAFVQHSVTGADGDREGTPVAVSEASGAGLPVIATRHAGIPDVVSDGKTGVLIEEGDIDGMSRAMVRLALSQDLAAEMGRAGHEKVSAQFTLEIHTSSLWDVIRQAMQPLSKGSDATKY